MADQGFSAQPVGAVEVAHDSKNYGAPDLMLNGPSSVKESLTFSHPLEDSEKYYWERQQQQEFQMLRKTQGLHAPLKLQMELQAARQIQRAPCLPSSNASLDTLLNRDETIGFEDYLNAPGDAEVMGNPHALMEKKLGLL
ncbi:proteasome maturation protein-like [Patiria miniata]|uniref:Proteasome maturation protein n=1 Tax=Patiria miniata TaxID=46514 RepID=A0A914AHL3_PATMI|nr:proteasome maturation protein-like [Patiria miniata]